ncbi:hypothetical protein EYF80_012414 [Liparis tanakae]|uniref:Uncharacterized protein n=1 Tax=Liparis tanakae TaxID=230148 RepID=A0A4Z2IH66_9TELE|nr:hypothetical protein EYF80_012414 [Liparis tanakae]
MGLCSPVDHLALVALETQLNLQIHIHPAGVPMDREVPEAPVDQGDPGSTPRLFLLRHSRARCGIGGVRESQGGQEDLEDQLRGLPAERGRDSRIIVFTLLLSCSGIISYHQLLNGSLGEREHYRDDDGKVPVERPRHEGLSEAADVGVGPEVVGRQALVAGGEGDGGREGDTNQLCQVQCFSALYWALALPSGCRGPGSAVLRPRIDATGLGVGVIGDPSRAILVTSSSLTVTTHSVAPGVTGGPREVMDEEGMEGGMEGGAAELVLVSGLAQNTLHQWACTGEERRRRKSERERRWAPILRLRLA